MEKLTKHIERMMKPYREIQKIAEPISKTKGQLSASTLAMQKAIGPTLELQGEFRQSLAKFQQSFEHINKIYASVPKFENAFLEHLETFRNIGEHLKEYAEKTPEYFLLIAQNGWFIDLENQPNFPSKVACHILDDNLGAANELLVDYYKGNIDKIFERLIERHSNRREIVSQILSAFKSENHSLLIPSVLAQVDGICFDFTKRKFFIKEKNNKYLPQITSELERSAESFLDLYLSPLQHQTPIMVREQDISKFPCNLNRHEILHGVKVDYGTEINSLKVISLFKYVSDLLTDLDRKTLGTTFYKRNGG